MTIEKLFKDKDLLDKLLLTYTPGYRDKKEAILNEIIDICDDFNYKIDKNKAYEFLKFIKIVKEESEQHSVGIGYNIYIQIIN